MFRLKILLLPVLLLTAGKATWIVFWGPQIEADSLGYLQLQIDFLHPPLYNVWVWLGMKCGGIWVVLLGQAAALSVGQAALVHAIRLNGTSKWIALGLLSLEPCGGYLCASLMSETLFLALLFGWMAYLLRGAAASPLRYSFLAGLGAGLIWLCRYTGLLLLPLFAAWAWQRRSSLKQWALALLLFLAGFQLMLLPLRAYYLQQWGVIKLNSLPALSTWNNACFLAPDYFRVESPANEMEEWAASFPDSVYSHRSTMLASGINSGEMPWLRWVAEKKPGTGEAQEAAARLGGLGRKLIFTFPVRWLREFVVPNFFKPLSGNEAKIEVQHPLQSTRRGIYFALAWQVGLLLLILAPGWAWWQGRLHGAGFLLLGFCWLHLAALSFGAVFFLRYAYSMIPLILLAVVQVLSQARARH